MGHLRWTAKSKFAGAVIEALERFANSNNEHLPSNLSQLTPYLTPPADSRLQSYQIAKPGSVHPPRPNSPSSGRAGTWADQFEVLRHGSLNAIQGQDIIVLREKSLWQHVGGKWGGSTAMPMVTPSIVPPPTSLQPAALSLMNVNTRSLLPASQKALRVAFRDRK